MSLWGKLGWIFPLHHPGGCLWPFQAGKSWIRASRTDTRAAELCSVPGFFHSVEFKFPSKLMLPEQYSPFLSPLPGLSLPGKEGQVQRSWSWCLPWEKLSCSAQEEPSF